jgi:hypothetical protein
MIKRIIKQDIETDNKPLIVFQNKQIRRKWFNDEW